MRLTHPTNLVNFSRLDINGTIVYFSYETPIALFEKGFTPLIAKNQWAQTTGKHINYVKRLIAELEYREVSHEILMDNLNHLQGGNTEHDNRFENNVARPGIY